MKKRKYIVINTTPATIPYDNNIAPIPQYWGTLLFYPGDQPMSLWRLVGRVTRPFAMPHPIGVPAYFPSWAFTRYIQL